MHYTMPKTAWKMCTFPPKSTTMALLSGPLYNFMGHHLKLNRGALPYDNGYQEDFVKVLKPDQLKVFDKNTFLCRRCSSGRPGGDGIPGITLNFRVPSKMIKNRHKLTIQLLNLEI